jgi:multicomponent Na+:H+ antiporter subunit E
MSSVTERATEVVRDAFTLRRLCIVAALTCAWCALWGSPSVANVLSGVAVSLLASYAGGNSRNSVRFVPFVRLLWLVFVDLVVSTGVVVREVLTPNDYTDEAIVAVPLSGEGRKHLLFMYLAITVTPGTAVVAGDSTGSTMYLHVLHGDRSDDVVEHVEELSSLVARAFPRVVAT